MLKLFEQREQASLGSIIASQNYQLRTLARTNYMNLTNYFKFSSYRLPNQHLLIQIVKNLEYSLETPFEKVVETVYARAPYVAKHFNLTSVLSPGKSHKGVFYGTNNSDVVDFVFSNGLVDIDPFSDDKSWRGLSPLRVIHHPCTDYRLLAINGQQEVLGSGYSVVHIDIPLLALQYREWCLQKIKEFDDEAVYNVNKFIVTDVLPKLYPSHMDYTMINLMAVQENLLEKQIPNRWLPLALPDLQSPAEKAIREIHRKLNLTRRQYNHTLESFPVLFEKNGLEVLKLPLLFSSRQTNWIELLSRLPVIETLFSLQGKPGRETNRSYIVDFRRQLGFFLTAKDYNAIESKTVRENLVEKLEVFKNY